MEVSEAMVAMDPSNLSIIGLSVEYEPSLLIGRKSLCWRTLAERRAYIEGGWESPGGAKSFLSAVGVRGWGT